MGIPVVVRCECGEETGGNAGDTLICDRCGRRYETAGVGSEQLGAAGAAAVRHKIMTRLGIGVVGLISVGCLYAFGVLAMLARARRRRRDLVRRDHATAPREGAAPDPVRRDDADQGREMSVAAGQRPAVDAAPAAEVAVRPVLLLTFDVPYDAAAVTFAFETAAETRADLLIADIVRGAAGPGHLEHPVVRRPLRRRDPDRAGEAGGRPGPARPPDRVLAPAAAGRGVRPAARPGHRPAGVRARPQALRPVQVPAARGEVPPRCAVPRLARRLSRAYDAPGPSSR